MNKPMDLTGTVFGRLTAAYRVSRTSRGGKRIDGWMCMCTCGGERFVRVQLLRNGMTRSCGCLSRELGYKRRANLLGKRFGRLVVIGLSPERSNAGLLRWQCSCDCGKTTYVSTATLRADYTQSCGCLRAELSAERRRGVSPVCKLPEGVAAFNALISKYRNRAARYGREWALTGIQAVELFKANCYYCGRTPQHRLHQPKWNGACNYNGIDRLDSATGYVQSNVVTACGECNRAKLAMGVDKFLELISAIYHNRIHDARAGISAGLLF